MRRRPLLLPAAAALLLAASSVRAETVPAERAALGWQTENADVVAVASVESEARPAEGVVEVTLRVEEPIRGSVAAGARVVVRWSDVGHGTPWTVGGTCLAFLDALPREGESPLRHVSISGAYGLRMLPASGPETRFPEIVRQVAATLDAAGAVREPAALRPLLVGWIEDADPGIAWSAATDLVRHEDLHSALTGDERKRIVDAYRRCPIGKETKRALAEAAAVARHASSAEALVESLSLPGARTIRGAVAVALRRLRGAETEELLDRALAKADAPSRANLLVAVGAVGTAASVPAVRRSLADDVADVRFEAAHAAGLVARNVRESDPAARIEVLSDLEHLLRTAKTGPELQAAAWALAQLDQPGAWDVLRRAAADDPRESVRKFAARSLARPRVSLLVE